MPTLIALAILLVVLSLLAQLWTEVLWYDSVGFRSVFTTELLTKAALFALGFAITAGVVGSSLTIGYRTRPIYAPVTPQQQTLDQYREAIEPLRRLAMIGIPAVLGLLAGSGAAGQWQTVLLWMNRQPFGTKDRQFNLDIGFFVFTLPWVQFVLGFLTMVLVMGLLAAAFTHYIYGGLQFQNRAEQTTRAARTHLAVLLAALGVVRAIAYWMDRYALTTKESDLITGIAYTDANAVLPTKAILAVATLICAGLFVASIWTRSWRLPVISVTSLVAISVIAGGIYPALIQSLRVKPSERTLQASYIQRNIDATLAAYGLEDIEKRAYDATTEATPGQLRDDADTIPGIRLVDPNVVSPTFKQLQAVRSYYDFPDALDVDRYEIDGKVQDTVIAVRELDVEGIPERNWINEHTIYTHGFGVVAAYGNQRGADGQPIFYQRNIPVTGPLGDFESRVYFGEKSTDYSIVGAPDGASPREFDYPDASTSGNRSTTYEGGGGVGVGSFARRVAYAIKYRETNFLLSDALNQQSRILDHRTPVERVERVAPWLTLDGNPYPAVVDGRVTWIVDGYTTTARYPYSRLQQISNATTDSTTAAKSSVRALAEGQVNYMRNSVKATVDAFDGSIKLYAWDTQDPVLKAWQQAFDGTVRPLAEIKGELMAHLRYPEDLFKVQRSLLERYHVTTPGTYFSANDNWRVPEDSASENAAGSAAPQPPYYQTLAMPGQESPKFSLTTTFIPAGDRQVLTGFLSVDADAGTETGKPSADYGKMRLLELPRDSQVKGPVQVQNDINSSNVTSPAFSLTLQQFLNNARQAGSSVTLGNLLTLPVGGGLLYVQPIYVRANSTTAYPLSRATVVAFGEKLAWSDTLSGALDGLFGGDAGADAGDQGTGGTGGAGTGGTGTGGTGTGGTGGTGGTPQAGALAQALADINKAYTDGEAALKAGDFTAYGEAQNRLKAAIAAAVAADAATGTPSGTPSSSPTSTATPTGGG